jgi:hypothetical protein
MSKGQVIRFCMKALALWLVGGLVISIVLARTNLTKFYRLRHDGVQTQGVVTALVSSDHQAVHYQYEAEGQTHSGSGMAGFGNPEFSKLTIGERVAVYYIPARPSESCLGVPDDLISNELPPVALAGITFPLFVIVVCSYRVPRFRRWLLR